MKMNAKTKFILTITLIASTLLAVSPVLRYGQRRFYSHTYERMTEMAYGGSKFDLVYLGSSRVHSGIDPSLVDQAVGTHSFNMGFDGATIYEFKLVLEAFLEHHPCPKLVVLNLDLGAFDLSRKLFDYIQYFQFLGNAHIKAALIDLELLPRYATWIPFLGFSFSDDFTRSNVLRGLMGKSEVMPGEKSAQGYLSPAADVTFQEHLPDIEDQPVDPQGPVILDTLIKRVKTEGKKIVLVFSPVYLHDGKALYRNSNTIMATMAQVAAQNDIPLVRYDQELLSREKSNFRNVSHLSYQGVQVFSKLLAHDVRGWLNVTGKP